jgi:hypothetical protein
MPGREESPLEGDWRYEKLATPIVLAAGAHFTIGAKGGKDNISWRYKDYPPDTVTVSSAFMGDQKQPGILLSAENGDGFISESGFEAPTKSVVGQRRRQRPVHRHSEITRPGNIR